MSKDDMAFSLRTGSKVAIAASCFSIYAFRELKEQLGDINELRFFHLTFFVFRQL